MPSEKWDGYSINHSEETTVYQLKINKETTIFYITINWYCIAMNWLIISTLYSEYTKDIECKTVTMGANTSNMKQEDLSLLSDEDGKFTNR